MTQQQPEASRIVEEAAIRILDELAVEGGRASRAHLFDKCQVMLWGHVVNVAARRAGYAGHNEAEVERHGKEQLFLEAMNLLLERDQIVVWDEDGNVIALHPTHRDGYVPGTNLWRSQRQTVLNELRDQLMQFRNGKIIGDKSFDATLQKAVTLYAQQLRRGQLAGDLREEAIGDLLGLADVLFDPARLAPALGVDESEVRAAAAQRHQPMQPAAPPKRSRRSTVKLMSDVADGESSQPDDANPPPEDVKSDGPDVKSLTDHVKSSGGLVKLADGLDMRRERTARGLRQIDIARMLVVGDSTVAAWELGTRQISAERLRLVEDFLAKHPILNGHAS